MMTKLHIYPPDQDLQDKDLKRWHNKIQSFTKSFHLEYTDNLKFVKQKIPIVKASIVHY